MSEQEVLHRARRARTFDELLDVVLGEVERQGIDLEVWQLRRRGGPFVPVRIRRRKVAPPNGGRGKWPMMTVRSVIGGLTEEPQTAARILAQSGYGGEVERFADLPTEWRAELLKLVRNAPHRETEIEGARVLVGKHRNTPGQPFGGLLHAEIPESRELEMRYTTVATAAVDREAAERLNRDAQAREREHRERLRVERRQERRALAWFSRARDNDEVL